MLTNQNKRLTFRPEKSKRILPYIFFGSTLILCILLGFALNSEITSESDQRFMNWYYIVVIAITALFGLYIWLRNGRKVIIDESTLSYIARLKKRSIALSDIKGYRISRSGLKLKFYPKKGTRSRSLHTFYSKELSEWVMANYVDLDKVAYNEEEAEILADPILGATIEERNQKLEKAKVVDAGISVTGFLLILLTFFFKLPYLINFYFTIGATLWVFFALIYFKGLIRMEWKTARVSMVLPVALTFVVYITGFNTLGSLSTSTILFSISIVTTGIAVTTYIFLIVGKDNYPFKKIWMSLILFFTLLLSFTGALNIVLDVAEPTLYTTKILEKIREKNTSSKSGLSYYEYAMELTPWNDKIEKNQKVDISGETYNTIIEGSTVEIRQHKGVFGDPWFTVHQNDKDLIEYDIDYLIFLSE